MKKKKHQPQPLILNEGYFIDRYFNGFEALEENTKNWEHSCTYQLQPNALSGQHQVLQLHSMQLLHAQRRGGFMHSIYSAKDCISVGVIEECADKACFDRLKLKTGDIVIFDDSRPYNYIVNDTIAFTVLSIRKSALGSLHPKLTKAINYVIKDTDGQLRAILQQTWKHFSDGIDTKRDEKDFKDAEEEICAAIAKLLEEQLPFTPKLTKGEETAFDIRDQVSQYMDGKININSFTKQYHLSRRTLQKSFKSLFGYTPKHFFQLLKLNHAYHDLKYADPQHETVSRIASKWGFMHMGHFSGYYTALFGEHPSETLKSVSPKIESMEEACADRKDEI